MSSEKTVLTTIEIIKHEDVISHPEFQHHTISICTHLSTNTICYSVVMSETIGVL